MKKYIREIEHHWNFASYLYAISLELLCLSKRWFTVNLYQLEYCSNKHEFDLFHKQAYNAGCISLEYSQVNLQKFNLYHISVNIKVRPASSLVTIKDYVYSAIVPRMHEALNKLLHTIFIFNGFYYSDLYDNSYV